MPRSDEHGQVVGYLSDGQHSRAYFWSDGQFMFLAGEGTESVALALNDSSQIVGVLQGRATLWTVAPCGTGAPDAGAETGDDVDAGTNRMDAGLPPVDAGGGKAW